MTEFCKAALIRAVRTMAQTAIAMIGTAIVLSDADWKMVLSASALAGILSILTSIATGLPEVQSADELKESDVDGKPLPGYEEDEDLLYVDDDVDEGDDDEVE